MRRQAQHRRSPPRPFGQLRSALPGEASHGASPPSTGPAGQHSPFWSAILLVVVVGLATAIGLPAPAAHADRFGLPWQGVVVVDGVVTRAEATSQSQAIGPLGKGARVPVLAAVEGEPGPDGSATWYSTSVGFLPGAVVREDREPWIAEVTRNRVPIHAKPDAKSPIRRHAKAADLLRVVGVSPGLDGDQNVWWATTEGFVPLDAIREATSDAASRWTMPQAAEAATGWWGQITDLANVRAVPSTRAPIVGHLSRGQRVKVLGEEQGQVVSGSPVWYRIDGGRYAGARVHSSLIKRTAPPPASAVAPDRPPADQTWIVVDRKASTLTLVEGGRPSFVTYVSLGKAGVDTPKGDYSTFGKFRRDDMTSSSVPNATGSYDLPNVPFTQYYAEGGYAIHGTYWHDGYGTVQSQGCVNLTVTDGAYLFERTKPSVPSGANERWASIAQATPVIILD